MSSNLSFEYYTTSFRVGGWAPEGVANVAESGSHNASRPKRKRSENLSGKDANDGPTPKKAKATKCPRGKRCGKKDKTKVTCYNCGKLETIS